MKKEALIILFLTIFLVQFVSADIIFNEPVESAYNLGENIPLPVTIKAVNAFSGVFQIDLICNGTAINFYKETLHLTAGEEKTRDPSLVLIKNVIGNENGLCKVKAIFGSEYKLSSEFKISDILNIETKLEKTDFAPKETIRITGKVTKETGAGSNGFIEAEMVSDGKNISQQGTVSGGSFELNLALPKDLAAGNYEILIRASEKDSNNMATNKGENKIAITINQIPSNLELLMENSSIMPGNAVSFTTILHDQSGKSIPSMVIVTIKNSNNKIIEQKEIQTEESFSYDIKKDQAPETWKIFAVSSKLTAEREFKINEKEEINVQIVNKTITVKNTGNVAYNKTILVRVGDNPVNIEVKLKVGESKKYVLNAPDGDYDVSITTNGIDELIRKVSLTGRTVEIKEAGVSSIAVFGWSFLILLLGSVLVFAFKKVYQKPFSLKMFLGLDKPKNSKKKFKEFGVENNVMNEKTGSKAELSLSIKGEKQNASLICIKLKNLKELKSKHGSAADTIEKLASLAEKNKGVIYENQDYLFFIFAPAKTKTFRNEKTAFDAADKMQSILEEHNRSFNQKIAFGMALNSGTIIAKTEPDSFKFMSLGNLITSSRKIASLAVSEILLSREINDSLRLLAKTEKEIREGLPVYKIKAVKRENEEAKKFIDKFMGRNK
jgi:hypothetical protein